MKKALILAYVVAAVLMTSEWLRPTEVLEFQHRVQAGESVWSICEQYYTPNSVECFNEMYSLNKEAIGTNVVPGQVLTIRNEVYK